MRPFPFLIVLALALLAACTTPCEELGNKICSCTAAGSARTQCEDSVSKQLDDANPNDATCEDRLGTCNEPAGSEFCEWIRTAEAKVQCGIAYGEPPAP